MTLAVRIAWLLMLGKRKRYETVLSLRCKNGNVRVVSVLAVTSNVELRTVCHPDA